MKDNIFVRLLSVLGIHALFGAIYWAIVQYALASEDNLAATVLERADGDPQRIAAHVGEVSGAMLQAGLATLLISALVAGLWLMLVDSNPPVGRESARRKRGSWSGLLLLIVVLALVCFWFMLIGAPIEQVLADNIPIYTAIYGVILAVIAYWLATALTVASGAKAAVPFALQMRS